MSGADALSERARTGDRSSSTRARLRKLRLWSGLVLFLYASMHLINHAFGIRSVEAMEWAAAVLLRPWETIPGLTLLYGAMITHAGLGLRALYRRRHLRILDRGVADRARPGHSVAADGACGGDPLRQDRLRA